jgi:acetyl-CoA carboxylase biotin carboxylase subunit
MRRVLIANRGEIAVRIIRACRESRIESAAIFSEADRHSPHVALADVATCIGPAPAADSYLSINKVIDAARTLGADAVHPGYGFLAENAAFADACSKAGLTFIGPPAAVIAQMGSKVAARRLMRDAGVPIIPGDEPRDQSEAGLARAAASIGYPLLVKAVAGGGGKGMRAVRDHAAFSDAIHGARREAVAAFGNGDLYVERLIERPRHVEVQILADHHGHIVHLFERDCSAQRRHQKVIEETPSPILTAGLRERMVKAAVAAARTCNYRNAGTIEFLVDGTGDAAAFYFLEMNTRLQVEHPVTEAVTGVDLVRAQLAVADGGRLAWSQNDLTQRGHAVQCRVYAEDPSNGFLPQAGRLLVYREPAGPGVRVDSGVIEGGEVSVHYDPLLAKLVVHAETRGFAIARALTALERFPVLGVATNVPFLKRVLSHPAFQDGSIDTSFLERELEALTTPASDRLQRIAAAAAVAGMGPHDSRLGSPAPSTRDPWTALSGWRGL